MGPSSNGESVTCMACRVDLVGVESRHRHYRSEFHRVNLQRKVANLTPLTETDFEERNEAVQREEAAVARRRGPRFCAICSKKFSSERALDNHIASRRHRDAVRARAPYMGCEAAAHGPLADPATDRRPSGEPSLLSPVDSESEIDNGTDIASDNMAFDVEIDIERRIAEASPFAANECVFDGFVAESVDANLSHMRSFGFFLPFREFLVDLTGLLEYIGQKVGIGYACLECDRPFTSVAAVQQHMVAKQHCRLTSNEQVWLEEFSPFYTFDVCSNAGAGEDDDWEELVGDDAVQAELAMVAEQRNTELRRGVAPDFTDAVDMDDGSTMEEVALVLGGNKVIGHRSLWKYYRQRIRAPDSRDAVVIGKAEGNLRIMGWKNGKACQDPELRGARMQAFQQNKRRLEVGMKNYYTRKAPLKVPFGTLNSGYRP